jgi:hypothetical protein
VLLDDVLEILFKSKRRLVVLDACRNNPVEEDLKRRLASLAGANRDVYLSRGLGRIPSGGGVMMVYSTQANDVAADGNATGRNSPFTTAFLKHVNTPDVDVRVMLYRVQDEVSLNTDGHQVPEVSVSSAGGFVLKPEASATRPSEHRSPPQPAPQPTFDPRAMELSLWESVRNSSNPAILQTYLDAYPNGRFAALANAKIQELQRPQQPTPPAAPAKPPAVEQQRIRPTLTDPCMAAGDHWRSAETIGTRAAYEDHLSRFANCSFAGLARARIAALNSRPASLPSGPAPTPSPPVRTFRVLSTVSQGIHNMRTGPGKRHSLVASIPAGATDVTIGRCKSPDDDSAYPWCIATWHGHTGWISSCCVVDANGRRP